MPRESQLLEGVVPQPHLDSLRRVAGLAGSTPPVLGTCRPLTKKTSSS